MIYLESFRLASEDDETSYLLGTDDLKKGRKLDMTCYSVNNPYPFKIFPFKHLKRLEFSPITLLYGGNGSGKSTVLNIIAQKLSLARTSPFNRTPFFEDYLELPRLHGGGPKSSRGELYHHQRRRVRFHAESADPQRGGRPKPRGSL